VRFVDAWTSAHVARVSQANSQVRLVELDCADWRPFTPGSHLKVGVLISGRHDTRCYSLVDLGVDDRRYRVAVLKHEVSLGGSRYMWSLAEGATLDIALPRNQFELNPHAPAHLLVAGGIGITPLLGMARALASRPTTRMLYAVRTRADAAFIEQLERWLGERLTLHVSSEGSRIDWPRAFARLPPEGEAYVCGPIAMMEDAKGRWAAAGRDAARLRYETFASGGHYPTQAFTAVLPRFGREVEVPANQSLLDVLTHAGIDVLSDCLHGECGLCMVDILNSDCAIDHRDVFLSDQQRARSDRMCACVSRAVGGRLVIDTAYRGAAKAHSSYSEASKPRSTKC
jgi:ferredoxin-NADP reductase